MKLKGLVALTGASGSGKSVAGRFYREQGLPVIDGDSVARKVQSKGSVCLEKLKLAFGDDIILPSGELDRKKLGSIVFADSDKLRNLNAIVHPLVVDEILNQVRIELCSGNKFCFVEAPALIESGLVNYCDKVVCIEAQRDKSLERIVNRDSLSEIDAQNRLNSQLSAADFRNVSDIVITNNGTLDDFYAALTNVLNTLKACYQ